MIINWITIKVKDYEKSKEFYRDFLGMKTEKEFSPNEDMSIAFFSAENGVKIELIYYNNLKLEDSLNSNVSIGICPSNYDEILMKSKEKNIITNGPIILGGNMECFFVSDPNGVGIQIIKII
ncbi:VOC family protein [Clostridium sp. AL.422]|uniref:VOC family protein n=1 Tax=Clostridium TaxID=1485 RepID=UPI00293DF7CC|nr:MULTISPECIES: VOC family protein [unclassified Clostridium]MDV4151969.1 VOC family protein [Clostridium sp. AL.422]